MLDHKLLSNTAEGTSLGSTRVFFPTCVPPFTATLTWSQADTHGDPPSPRHGHVVVAVGTKLFIHGGLAGDVFYNDLFCIDTSEYGQRYQSCYCCRTGLDLGHLFSVRSALKCLNYPTWLNQQNLWSFYNV